MLFAVQDFSQSVASLSLVEQEKQVAAALAARGLQVANFGPGAFTGANVNRSNGGGNSMQTVASRSARERELGKRVRVRRPCAERERIQPEWRERDRDDRGRA